ncbi:hypothetical protein LXA43DRAFT_1162431 [Ganoderma leucocontextum]|nr:hypothetical protein LXA43DRAFT_1162431 [Ganoderma leucocontextum]
MIFQAWKHSCGAKEHGLVAEWVRATWVCKAWRGAALETAALWSSVLVSRRLADDPALEMQLDRARGVALDLLVFCLPISNVEIEKALGFVLSKTKSIEKLKVIYGGQQNAVVEAFVKVVGAEVVSLSLLPNTSRICEWRFTPDAFPRLRHLVLDSIIPTPGAPLLTLTRLEVAYASYAYDDHPVKLVSGGQQWCTYVHKFLAVCPNLETLRTIKCFHYPSSYSEHDQPIVTLPKLRYLSVEEFASGLSKAFQTLRLPSSSSFHITADCDGDTDHDYITLTIPRNVSESLPPIRRTRCLSLMVGQRWLSHLSLRGGPGDTFKDESDWSITIPDTQCSFQHSRTWASRFPDWESAKLYHLGYTGNRPQFLDRIPNLVVPSRLVQLQLHIALGLPVARDWARFFTTMPRLRTLGIGGGALITHALQAFEADPSLCPDLEDLELCATAGRAVDEGVLAGFIPWVIGAWLRQRTRVGTGLSSLTVRTPAGGSGARAGLGGGQGHDADLVGFASKLRQDLALLKGSVGEVLVEAADCPACGVEYELPVEGVEGSDEDSDEESEDGSAYYY